MKTIFTHKFLIIISSVFFFFLTNCAKKKGEYIPVTSDPNCISTFDTDVKPIINTKCAIAGCHNSGALIGDFTTYAGLKPKIDNGRIRVTVFETQTMPYGTSPDLTPEELEKLKCWLDNGAPNN